MAIFQNGLKYVLAAFHCFSSGSNTVSRLNAWASGPVLERFRMLNEQHVCGAGGQG
jgi:hypothetical protein